VSAPSRAYRLWLLRLVPERRFGRLLTAVVILIVLLGWFWTAGIFLGPTQGTSGAAAFFAVILAYIVPVFHYITERTRRAFDDLTPHLDADVGQIASWRNSIDHKRPRWIVANLAIGILAWTLHTILLRSEPAAAPLHGVAWFAIITGPGFVWIVMTCTVHALIDNARLFKRLARHVRIDLVNPAPLTAFARVAVISTLAIVGAQAAFPIMLIDPAGTAAASIPGLIVTSGAMAMLFVLPIWPIHREIVAAKKAELHRINTLLAAAGSTNGPEEARERIAHLNLYLVYRREISAVHEWPFDTGIATRLAFYLIIPPLTWIGAAFIDVAVERFV
jgi:hypothetical protein